MRRLIVANLLVFAVLASAAALAYYGWSYTAEVSSREREIAEEAMQIIAEEKIAAIEKELIDKDRKLFARIDPAKPLDVAAIITEEGAPVLSVYILDADLQPIGSGYFSKLEPTQAASVRDDFLARIKPTLPIKQVPGEAERGRFHTTEDGLFSYARKGTHYIVLETDLVYLVTQIFRVVLDLSATKNYLFQVIDENGEGVYGPDFKTTGPVIELPFSQTVTRWKLRVGQRGTTTPSERGRRKLIDIVLIGLALGGIVAGLGVLLLAMRRERKANELKSDFISNVSHELKTPLSIISMFGEMLALGRVKTSEQATEYAEIIWRESVRLARLIDNVLDFAKIERGKDVYEFAGGDVAEVIGRAIELSQHRLAKAELTVETDLEPDLPPARIDANAYTLAVMNLIDNAIKYAPEGKRLVIRLRRRNERIVLEVKDFGPGIDPSEHERIFERFYRARAVRLKPIRGSGIGLALVDHIARAHGGGVWVDSTPGEGATFGLWIPAGAAELEEAVV
jgi:two-component system, OmpR family, phosphate regulon sensor histidine kinase PhoR